MRLKAVKSGRKYFSEGYYIVAYFDVTDEEYHEYNNKKFQFFKEKLNGGQ